MAIRTVTCVFLAVVGVSVFAPWQGVGAARPWHGPHEGPDEPEPLAANYTGARRSLLQSGPQSAGCAAAGLSCCYSPTWWIQQQPAPSVTCTTGTQNSVTAAALLQACQDGSIGGSGTAPCSYLEGCTDTSIALSFCNFYENIGDYTHPMPCSTNEFNGQTITVYDEGNLVETNNEIVWEDAKVTSGEPTGVQACNVPQGASYTLTATYSKSSSWNIGVQLGAKILKDYEAKLTAGYSQTYTRGQNAGVTVMAEDGQHATVTSGTLVHHSLGWWDIKFNNAYEGCTEYRVDNVAADLIMPTSDPYFPSDYGVEAKPCGYPLLDGSLN